MASWPNIVLAKEGSGPYQSIGGTLVGLEVFEHPQRVHGACMPNNFVQPAFTAGGNIDLVHKLSVRATGANQIIRREGNRAANLCARRRVLGRGSRLARRGLSGR